MALEDSVTQFPKNFLAKAQRKDAKVYPILLCILRLCEKTLFIYK